MKNEYIDFGEVVGIIVKNRGDYLITLIDKKDFAKADEIPGTWSARYDPKMGNCYVSGKEYRNNKQASISLHRWLMGNPKGKVIDHINHNTLDNRSSNLRSVTHRQNLFNRSGTSKRGNARHRGVHYQKSLQKWKVEFKAGGKYMYFGVYENLEDAIKVADRERSKLSRKIGLNAKAQ